MNEVIRSPTTEEKRDFVDIAQKDKDARIRFEAEMAEEMQKAIKAKRPFAAKACRDEFNDYYKTEVEKNIRKNGFLEPSEIKPLKVNFSKFSDLTNFDVIETGEQSDENLTKHNPGLDVRAAFTVYKFKGYSNKYTVMESGTESILRARAKLRDLESETPKKKVK